MSELMPFPFIVGCGRSGTTLLRAMLERHPDLAIPPESYFPVSLAALHDAAELDRAALLRGLEANPRFRGWGLASDVARAALEGAPTYADAMRALYAAYAAARGASRYGDKTPPFVLHVDLLASLFPEARFVHLIRDGRDVAASLVGTRFGPRGLLRAAEVWVRRVSRGRASGALLGPSRYLELRYEDLVSRPEATVRAACRFVELDFREEMMHPEEGDTALPARERAHHASLARPVTPGLRDWRRDLAPRDVAAIEAIAGGLLDELGYGRGFPRVPLVARARARVATAATAATRRARRGARSLRP